MSFTETIAIELYYCNYGIVFYCNYYELRSIGIRPIWLYSLILITLDLNTVWFINNNFSYFQPTEEGEEGSEGVGELSQSANEKTKLNHKG